MDVQEVTMPYEEDRYLFHNGEAQQAYRAFGCHFNEELDGHEFMVWAPNASGVSVIGDFNEWSSSANTMTKLDGSGVWYALVSGLNDGDLYKYYITTQEGVPLYKADPFAFYSQLRPATASRVWSLDDFKWKDTTYLKKRKATSGINKPVSVYELHLGSWKKTEDDEFLNYREIADKLVPYIQTMGFTHVELLPVSEHPFDDSWGYQVTGYYSITARYGTPQDFMYFVDKLHRAGIGVILDWVPAHFPRDAQGLRRFDGTAVYEHENPLQGEQPQWGTHLFNFGCPQVVSFLVSNAEFLINVFHLDGLRIDAVSAILYWNFGKEEGQYIPNPDGTVVNHAGVEFLKKLNATILTRHPDVMMIAEESSAFPMVTKPPYDNGLGFTYKWDMGFMNDMLRYMEADPLYRRDMHNYVTFSMMYAFSENYMLAFSHDEVVHGKRSMLDKMSGNYNEKFASLRAFYGYLFSHPGKKLLFMGDEIGQFIEWNHHKELEWFLLEYDSHKSLCEYVRTLNHFYRENPALFEMDTGWDGFEWLNVDDNSNSVVAYLRKSAVSGKAKTPRQYLVSVTNFTPVQRDGYRIGLPFRCILHEVLNSDSNDFGGNGALNPKEIKAASKPVAGKQFSAAVTLPGLSTLYFICEPTDLPVGAGKSACKSESLAKTRKAAVVKRLKEEDNTKD